MHHVLERDWTTLHVHNMVIIVGSIVNMIGRGDLYDHLMSSRVFTFIMNTIFIRAPKPMT